MKAADLFAGWGGFTAGAKLAGVDVVYAANHWPIAVAAHAHAHPETLHVCQDLRQADWSTLPHYDLLLASPACQGHSQCSQPKRRPRHDADRATAWAVIDCAEITRPRAVIVENVFDFRAWQLYPLWREALRLLGYHVAEHEVDARQSGVPQRRRRLIITATRRPFTLRLPPRPSHDPPFGPCLEPRVAGWRPVAGAPADVKDRIARGRARCGRRFLSQHVTNHPGVPLHEAIRTITTKDQWVLVDGPRYRSLTIREYARGMGFDDSYSWPAEVTRTDCVKGLGNAVPPPMGRDVVAAVADAA